MQAVAEYEQRYELGSDMMAKLVDREAIIPTIDIIEWYHAYTGRNSSSQRPADWNSWDNCQYVHHRRLSEHNFAVEYRYTPSPVILGHSRSSVSTATSGAVTGYSWK